MKCMQFCAIIYLFLIIPNIFLFAQNDNISFEHLTTKDGLSSDRIPAIIQDYRGFMWFGTMEGLNRYDGYNIKVYRHDPDDSSSISNNYILCLFEESDSTLWIGTIDGLNKFVRETNSFVRYQHDPGDSNSISYNTIDIIREAEDDNLWIGTYNGGLNLFDKKTKKFIRYLHDPNNPNSLSNNHVYGLHLDQDNNLWIGTENGLNVFNPKKKSFKRYYSAINNKDSLSSNRVVSIYEDKNGLLWIGTRGGGLLKFDKESNKFVRYCKNINNQILSKTPKTIFDICEDRYGILWLATSNNGLSRFNPETGIFKSYTHNPEDPNSLSQNRTMNIYIDSNNAYWVGTYNEGVNIYQPERSRFSSYKLKFNESDEFQSFTYSIYMDSKDSLWISTPNGLFKFDSKSKEYCYYLLPDLLEKMENKTINKRSISHSKISKSIIYDYLIKHFDTDNTGNIWMATYGNGLLKYNQNNGVNLNYKFNKDNQNSLSSNYLDTIIFDSFGKIWIHHFLGYLNILDAKSGNVIRLNREERKSRGFTTEYISAFFEDKYKVLWIATLGDGLYKFDRDNNKFIAFKHQAGNPRSISDNLITMIHESSSGDFWVATANGLNLMDRKTNQFFHFAYAENNKPLYIQGILEDEHGNLWLNHHSNISKFDPGKKEFEYYDHLDGIDIKFSENDVCTKDKNGNMYFGGTKGILIFHPDSVNKNKYIPPIIINSFKIKNTRINFDSSIVEKKSILLSYNQNFFSIYFSALNYLNPNKNKYAYKLEGLNTDWVHTDASQRFATYTNLDPGEYIFRVKGSNNDGIWNEEGTSLIIIITPPWWQTWWFRILMTLVFIGILYWIFKYRTSALRKKHQAQKEFSRKLIDSQEKERKRIATALHDSHGQNLLIISNEMQQYVDKHKKAEDELRNVTDTIQDSINEIREISYDLHPHILERVGIEEAIDSMIGKISKSTDLQFDLILDKIDNIFDKKIEINIYRIIQEAVNNIIKHSNASEAKIEINKNRKYVNIIISDNGIGFNKKSILNENNGLGLVGMKERVNLINGKYNLKSEQGRGTKIEIKIPFKA